ncbi:MAG: DUF6502 family protein [Pseudomonadota bacterium]
MWAAAGGFVVAQQRRFEIPHGPGASYGPRCVGQQLIPKDTVADISSSIGTFVRRMLRPIVSITLRSGITFRQFADLLRLAYVDVAMKEFGIDGRPTNISRVAMLTGLTRRDASRQRDILAGEESPTGDRVHSAARVLMGWHTDEAFLDEQGGPLTLPMEGELSFTSLYKRYSGADIPLTAMLKELMSVGAVKREDDGALRPLTRYFQPESTDPHAIERAGLVLADLGTTVRHNIYREDPAQSRFEGRAWSAEIPLKHAPAFRAFLEERAQTFLEDVDAWLIAHENSNDANEESVRIGAGAYEIHTIIDEQPTQAAAQPVQQEQ